jgi:hypothetical protein
MRFLIIFASEASHFVSSIAKFAPITSLCLKTLFVKMSGRFKVEVTGCLENPPCKRRVVSCSEFRSV